MNKDVFSQLTKAIDTYTAMRSSERAFWHDGAALPERDLLELLLSVAAQNGCEPRKGNIAGALDVWLAEELRLAGFEERGIWPRRSLPQVVDPEVELFIKSLPTQLAHDCGKRLEAFGASDARVLGAAYSKQVDVGMASWPSGPEILISTKTMSGSFGKNWANRFEEAYGDVKNLKSRHPLAVTGFVMLLHNDVLKERGNTNRIISMLHKLQVEQDAYDAVALVFASWDNDGAELTAPPIDVLIEYNLSIDRFLDSICLLALERGEAGSHARVRELRSHSY